MTWTPDGLYYQVQLLEFRGVDHDDAFDEDVRRPAFGGAARQGSAPHRRRRVGRVQRALLRAPARAPAGRRRPLRRRRRSFASLHLARGLRRRDSRAVRTPAPALPARCGRSRDAAGRLPPTAHAPLVVSANRQLGARAGDRRFRCRDSRLRPGPQVAPALDRGDRPAGVHARQCVDPDPRGRLVRVPVPLARARDAVRERRRGRAPGHAALQDAGPRSARAARERLRAVVGHVVGVHRRATIRRRCSSSCERTSGSSGAASGTPRLFSSAVCSRCC